MGRLTGVRVLVTRPRGSASKLAAALQAEGAEPILIPSIEIAPPLSWCGLDAALVSLRSYDWVLFTSANAAEAFADRARALNLPANPRKVAAIGSATAAAVAERLGQRVDLLPERFVAESLLEALRPHAAGASMLLVRAAVARDVLPEGLAEAGATVTIVEAYRNVVPRESVAELQRLFAERPPQVITMTSGSAAENLARLLHEAGLQVPAGAVLASIGPVTSAVVRELGWSVGVEAREATVAGLVEAVARTSTANAS
jgi:uroporphyrinogen-III synthase